MNAFALGGRSTESRPRAWRATAGGWLGGVLATLGIFLGIARFDRRPPVSPPPEVDDLRAVAVSEPPPPPPPETQPVEAPAADVLSGLERLPSDSPVRITVPPPDLGALLPPPATAPAAVIPTGQLYTSLRPKVDASGFRDRIYQMAEVDQIPKVLTRVDPRVPPSVRSGVPSLRTTLLFVVDANGEIRNLRIAGSSGNAEFDQLILANIQEWTFSPAVRHGRRVRCLLQQSVTVKWSGSHTSFTL